MKAARASPLSARRNKAVTSVEPAASALAAGPPTAIAITLNISTTGTTRLALARTRTGPASELRDNAAFAHLSWPRLMAAV
jgi:hypothetical protein